VSTTALDSILGGTGLTPTGVIHTPALELVQAVPSFLRFALEYAELGYRVIPLHSPEGAGCSCGHPDCESRGKHPRTRAGLKDATSKPETIRGWWERWPKANIGLATGPLSGFFVLDCDGKQGEASLIEMAKHGCSLPDTYIVRTGRGSHFYFNWPDNQDVRNSQSKIAPGLDIRGDGGFVVAPPSVHASGAQYEIAESSIPAVDAPEWLLSLIKTPAKPSTPLASPVQGAVGLIPKGKGDPAKLTLAGVLLRKNVPVPVIEAAVIALDKQCEHQAGEDKCKSKTAEWVKRYGKGEAIAEQVDVTRKPDLVCLADVKTKRVDWLWEPYIPLGMVTVLDGDPGVGKSFCALSICADLTQGHLLDGRRIAPANVLYLSVENPIAECVRPRFDSLGGAPQRFFALRGTVYEENGEQVTGAVTLADVSQLEQAIVTTKARLVVIDPIQSYLGASVDLHRSNETRPVMDGLSKLAEKYGCALLILRHLSKQTGGKAIFRGLGSIDITGAARSVLLAGSMPNDPETRAIVHTKSNVGRYGRTRGFSIDGTGQFSWTVGECSITANDLLAAPDGQSETKLDHAKEWLTALLQGGSKEQNAIIEAAKIEGINERTLRRAKESLRVKSRKASASGGWIWNLESETTK